MMGEIGAVVVAIGMALPALCRNIRCLAAVSLGGARLWNEPRRYVRGATVPGRACVAVAGLLLLLAATPRPALAARAASGSSTGDAHAATSLSALVPFTHLTIEHGLSDGRVLAIVQDHDGFLWFGTNQGLNRFDGYNIVAYRHDPADPHSLSGNYVAEIFEDRAGTLWVGTWSGLNAFDRRTERFRRYQHDPADPRSLSHNTVLTIYEDRSGVLWVGTTSGLNRFDRATGAFTVYRHDPANPRSLSHDYVRAIREDRSGTLWIGTESGLNRFDRATGAFTVYRHDPANPRSLSDDNVWDIYEDRAGRFWVGTDGGGLSRLNKATGAFTHYRHDPSRPDTLGHDQVDCIAEDVTGRLWIGTFGGGVSVFDVARNRFTTHRHDPTVPGSLSNGYIAEIIADRSGLLWIATQGSGVERHDPRPPAFSLYRHDPKVSRSLASHLVRAVAEDRDGRIWIGTEDRGLDCLDRQSGRVVHYPPDPRNPRRLGHPFVTAIEQDREGALWVGTFGGGLYRRDPSRDRFTAYRHDAGNPKSLSSDTISDLLIDRSGVLWVGTLDGGLNRFDPESGAFTAYRNQAGDRHSLGSDVVWSLAEDRHGSLWIGTWDGGLNRLEPATGRIQRYRHDPKDPASLSEDNVWALHIDRSGVIWVGTFSSGLDRFDPASGVFANYRERDGLASNRIVQILEDGDAGNPSPGNLWIATGRGLSKLDRDRKTLQTYDTSDGLPLMEYNRGGCRTRGGDLLMGTLHGLIAFDPDEVRDDTQVPPVVFTQFLLANKQVPIGDESPLPQAINQTSALTLTHADRVISFEFAALSYRAARQNRYRYKLEGFDDDWIEVGSSQRLVTYTNLHPRRYVFRVMGANADGVWNTTGRAITLVITPPWWATWWFRGLALSLITACASGAYAWRIHSLHRQRDALEAEIIERRQAEQAMRESEERMRLAVSAADMGVWLWRGNRLPMQVDARTRELLGLPPDTEVDFSHLLDAVHPADRVAVQDELRQARLTGIEYDVECRVLLPDGSTRWVASRGRAYGEFGHPSHHMKGVVFDVTAAKQAQEEAMRHLSEVAHLGRVTAMGEMVASIAHDLNQPLGAILGNVGAAEMLLDAERPDLALLKEILADIRDDDQRAGEVVRSMRAMLRRKGVERQPLDINDLVRATVRLVAAEASLRHILLQMNLAPDLPPVSADRVHLQQVLLNLMVNGMDAMTPESCRERKLVVEAGRAGEEVEVAVSDRGPGFAAGVLEQIFEPFFTTKKEGMGMGLSIARTIIEMHGGRIGAENRVEGGAAVRFTLPCAERAEGAGTLSASESPVPLQANLGTIP